MKKKYNLPEEGWIYDEFPDLAEEIIEFCCSHVIPELKRMGINSREELVQMHKDSDKTIRYQETLNNKQFVGLGWEDITGIDMFEYILHLEQDDVEEGMIMSFGEGYILNNDWETVKPISVHSPKHKRFHSEHNSGNAESEVHQFDSIESTFYENGNLKTQLRSKDDEAYVNIRDIGKMSTGEQIEYFENGQLKFKADWVNGIQQGLVVSYDERGNKIKKSNFLNGNYEGEQIEWYSNGKIKAERIYEKDKIISEKKYNIDGQQTH